MAAEIGGQLGPSALRQAFCEGGGGAACRMHDEGARACSVVGSRLPNEVQNFGLPGWGREEVGQGTRLSDPERVAAQGQLCAVPVQRGVRTLYRLDETSDAEGITLCSCVRALTVSVWSGVPCPLDLPHSLPPTCPFARLHAPRIVWLACGPTLCGPHSRPHARLRWRSRLRLRMSGLLARAWELRPRLGVGCPFRLADAGCGTA